MAALLAAGTAFAASSATEKVCDEISAALADRVWAQSDIEYTSETNSYWSTALRDAKPACLVLPQSADEVSSAVKVLNKYPNVQFAVKSGGHTPNQRHSSIKDGVLISTRDMAGVTYDKETGIAQVKPGGEWNDVIGPLDEEGVTVLGGRLGNYVSKVSRCLEFSPLTVRC
ncbi:FAD-binding protein [Candidatus Bathyarchaeota archaeon]|nr:FAD-binding protein [Candidatus Bathyarchaeota archaeon]